jgi:hypothetical protein
VALSFIAGSIRGERRASSMIGTTFKALKLMIERKMVGYYDHSVGDEAVMKMI